MDYLNDMKKIFCNGKDCENYDQMFNEVMLNVKTLPTEIKLITSILRTEKLLMHKLDEKSEKVGLTSAQFHILIMVYLSEDKLTQQEISNKLILSKANVSSILSRMESQNLLKRENDPVNKKINKIKITTKGKKLTEEYIPNIYKYHKDLCSKLTKKEQEELILSLKKLREGLI